MKPLFQKAGKGPATQTGGFSIPRLTLAAFGKHPGWDDHMPGIGIETETLAYVKQTLYVNGIGRQIDSGAWEKLDPDKRLEGFAHTFLWLRGGHAILGQMWSSKDGKGRSKYPMVLAIDGESVTPDFMVAALRGGLENLREACKIAPNAEQVNINCRAAQEQLRLVLGGSAGLPSDARPLPDGRRFLERPELGPGRMGMLRILHELAAAFDLSGNTRPPVRGAAAGARSLTLRVPFASDSEDHALLLWAAFLGSCVGPSVPLLLFARSGTDWVDAMVGEPASDDFFCLQASLKGLPLATQIPYELSAESRQRLLELEARFLDEEPAAIEKPAPPSSPQPPPPAAKGGPPPAPSGQGKSKTPLIIFGLVLLLVVVVLLVSQGGKQSNEDAIKLRDDAQRHSDAPIARRPQTGENRAPYTNSVGMEFIWLGAVPVGGAYVGKYDVTRKQYREVMKTLPQGEEAVAGDDNLPVANVTFDDADKFCEVLSTAEKKPYSLPSKAQWLAMAGLSDFSRNREIDVWDKLKNDRVLDHEITSLSGDRSRKGPEKVGLATESNGLCDLFGNVREWTAGGEKAGFSYSCNGTTPKLGKLLFLDSSFTDPWLLRETGFRCILQEKK